MNRRKPKIIDLVMFDWDGTLIDSREALVQAWHQSTERVIGRRFPETPEEYADIYVRRGMDIFADITPDRETAAALAAQFDQAYQDLVVKTFPGVPETLSQLRDSGVSIAVVTSKLRGRFERDAAVTALTDLLDYSICGDDVMNAKPHPEPVHLALSRSSREPSQTVLVGDTQADVGAGIAAGVRVIGAGWGYGDNDDLLQHGASVIVDDPVQLLQEVEIVVGP